MTDVAANVRAFYREMPFNFYSNTARAADSVRANPIAAYPDLDALLEDEDVTTVLELGCGAGWAANSMAHHYGKRVTAVDFTTAALDRAREVAKTLGHSDRVRCVESDLFNFATSDRFDLVASIGVLHHTRDCRAAFDHAASFVAPGRFLFVGLYHSYGRRPFLQMYRELVARDGEEAAFAEFRRCAELFDDPTHSLSWFRDQVLHPHETQHSLAEVWTWLDAAGLSLVSTSLNTYGDISDRAALVRQEQGQEALSWQRNRDERSYFPGFFTVLACRA